MRKLKIALLIALILCLVCGVLVACDPIGKDPGAPDTPGGPGDPEVPDSGIRSVSSSQAYAAFKEAALNVYAGNYFNFSTTIGLDYIKDKYGRYFAVKIQAAIDPEEDANSEMLVELWRMNEAGGEETLLLGLYYFDGTIVYDCTGIKKGAQVVKTEDLDITAIAKAVDKALGGTSVGQLLLDNLLGIELGDLGSVERILTALFAPTSRAVVAADGTVEYQIPINLASVLGLVGGLIAPDGLLGDYSDLILTIGNVLGIDLGKLSDLDTTSTAIYLVATVGKDAQGQPLLVSGPVLEVGMDFNTSGGAGSEIMESELDVSVGLTEIQAGTAPVLNLETYLVSERGYDLDELTEYSPLTLELSLDLDLDLKEHSFEIQTILGALGGLLGDVSVPEALKTLNIDIAEDTSLTLGIKISAEINMRDPAGTNAVIDITGTDGALRGRVAYIGAERSLYADLTGILGRNAKVKITDFDLNAFLSEQIDSLLVTINEAIAGLTGDDQAASQAEYDAAKALVDEGEIVKHYVASLSDDEPATLDTIGLIMAILENIDVDMNGDIFNIEGIGVTLTKQIINSIVNLISPGATLPLMGDVALNYSNPGFGETKELTISGLAIGVDDGSGTGAIKTLAEVGLGIGIRLGTFADDAGFRAAIEDIATADANHEYAALLTFDQLLNTDSIVIGDILANVGTVSVDLSLGIDIDAIGGEFLDFTYGNSDFLIAVLAAFAEEGLNVGATLKLSADVDLAALLTTDATGALALNAAGLLTGANLYLALIGGDGTAALEVWLNGGVAYLHTTLLGGFDIKVDIGQFFSASGQSEASALAAANEGEESGFDIASILALLGGVGVGDTYIDVYLAAFTLSELFETLGVSLGDVGISLIDPDGEESSITGGVKIELGDGLNLGEAGISVYLGLGEGADIELSLGGFGAGIGSNAGAIIPEDRKADFVDILSEPYLYLHLNAGLEASIKQQGISLGEELGDIVIGSDIDIAYSFDIEAFVDLRPIVGSLLGTDYPAANDTQIVVKLAKNEGGTGEEEVLLGVYYKDGRAYLDLAVLGIAPASIELDLMQLITGQALAGVEPLAGSQAYAADGGTGGNDVKTAVQLALEIGTDGLTVTLVQGLVELLVQYVAGLEGMEIDALLNVDWSEAAEDLLALEVGLTDASGNALADLALTVGGIELALGKALGDGVAMTTMPEDDVLAGMTSLGSVVGDEYQLIEKVADAQAYAGNLFRKDPVLEVYTMFKLADGIALRYAKGEKLYIAVAGENGATSYKEATLAEAQAAPAVFVDAEGKTAFTMADAIALEYENGGKLYSNAVQFALTMPAVHVEFAGEITLGVDPDTGATEWTIGSWITNFLKEDSDINGDGSADAADAALYGFISALLLEFNLVDEAMVTIGLNLAANLRFNPDDVADIAYILGHSDISLVVTGTDAAGSTETLLGLYIVANEQDNTSTLYLETKEGGLLSGLEIKVPGLDLGTLADSLFAGGEEGGAEGQALASSSDDGSESGGTDILGVIEGVIAGAIYSIIVDNQGVTVNFASAMVAYVLTLIPSLGLPDAVADPDGFAAFAESFVELNPARSYLSVLVGDNAGGLGGNLALELGLGIDPVYLGIALGGLSVGFAGEGESAEPVFGDGSVSEQEYFADFVNFYEIDALSIGATAKLDLTLKSGELELGSMLDILIGEALVAFGVDIPEDLRLSAEVFIGANISVSDPDKTQIVLELRDGISDTVVFGAYLDGATLWIKGGELPIGNVRIENTGFAALIGGVITDLLSSVTASGSAEALAAAEGETYASNDALAVFFELAKDRIALSITETFLVALISAVTATPDGDPADTDIAGIIERLGLDAEVNVGVDFSTFTIDIGLESNLLDLGISIVEPTVGMTPNEDVANAIAALAGDDSFTSYPATSTRVGATVDLSLSLGLGEGELTLSDLLGVILDIDAVKNGIAGLQGDAGKILGTLLNALGLELVIAEGGVAADIGIHISALLDLKELGSYAPVSAEFAKENLGSRNFVVYDAENDTFLKFTGTTAADVDAVYNEGGPLYAVDGLADKILSGDFESIFTYTEIDKANAVEGETYILVDGVYGVLTPAEGQTFAEAVEAYGGTLYSRSVEISLDALLAALEANVRLTVNDRLVDIYLADGQLYLDLGGFDGPKVSIDLMWLIDMISKATTTAEGMSADDENGAPAEASVLDTVLSLVNSVIKRVSLGTAISNVGGNLLAGGLGANITLGADVLSAVLGQLIGTEITTSELLLAEDGTVSLKLQPQDEGRGLLELAVGAVLQDGVRLDLGLGAGLDITLASPIRTLIDEETRASFTDITPAIESILALVNGTAADPDAAAQPIKFSIMGRVYFDANGEANYELGGTVNSLLGSLLSVYINDLYVDLGIKDGVSAGLGFRLTAGLDLAELAKIDLDACKDENGALDAKKFVVALLKGVPSLKIALELIELDENLEFATYTADEAAGGYVTEGDYKAMAGIYIQNGNLYLNGTNIFGVADNYTQVPGFTTFVAEALEDTPEETGKEEGTEATTSAEAYSSADGTVRDALLQALLSSEGLKIVATKSILSLLIATLMPDLGSLTDIFDQLDVFVELDTGDTALFLGVGAVLGANGATQSLGLELGAIKIEVGADAESSVVPAFITAGKTPDGKESVPLAPFYDSVVSLSTSVEFELGITEGVLDFGGFLKDIVGDIGGVTIEMPETAKGYSSAHFRLDLYIMLNMYDLAQSELYIELYNLSNEAGAEVLWLGAYYSGMTVYLDLSFFGLPRISAPLNEISGLIDEYLGDLLDSSIFDTVVVPSAPAESEGLAADEQSEEADITSVQDKVASLVISERRLALHVGNYLMRYILSAFDIGGITLADLIYENLYGELDIEIYYGESLNVEIGARLALEGDRYVPVELTDDNIDAVKAEIAALENDENAAEEAGYYTFEKGEDGKYALTSDGEYRLLGTSETNPNNEGYIAPADRYVGTKLDSSSDITVGTTVYKWEDGDELNMSAYDAELDLSLGIKNFELGFVTEHQPILSGSELEQYMDFNAAETVSLSETLSLDLLLREGADIDLAGLLGYLFEGTSEDIVAIISAAAANGGDLNRHIDLVIAVEFRLGAFLNYMRSLAAQYPLMYSATFGQVRDTLLTLGDEVDLLTFVGAIMSVVGAKVPDASGNIYHEDAEADDLVGLEDLLEFVNASVRIVTNGDPVTVNGEQVVPMHDILGVYFVGGEFREATAEDEANGEQLYSHFFRSQSGAYAYDKEAGSIRLISDITGTYDPDELYGYDASYMYPVAADDNHNKGTHVREDAGLYVDLSYLGQPSIYIALSELQNFVGDLMSETDASAQALAAGGTDAAASADEDDAPPTISLGNIAGSLPLLGDQIASYVTAFLYGIRMTSSFIQVLVDSNYLNSLLGILLGEDDLLPEMTEQSSLTINTDVNNYEYFYATDATNEQLMYSDSRFHINIDDENGVYYLSDDDRLELRSRMTESEAAAYQGNYYTITAIDLYLNVEGEFVSFDEASNADWRDAERYTSVKVQTSAALGVTEEFIGTYVYYVANENGGYDELDYTYDTSAYDGEEVFVIYPSEDRNPLIELEVYLWEYKIGIAINLPETGALDYTYRVATPEEVEAGIGLYAEGDEYVYELAAEALAERENAFVYFRGKYFPLEGNLYKYEDGKYNKHDEGYDLGGSYAVACREEGFVYYVPVTADKHYERVAYGAVYTAVTGDRTQGSTYYVREEAAATSVSYPEMFVDFSKSYANASAAGITVNICYEYSAVEDAWVRLGGIGDGIEPDHENGIYLGSEVLHTWDPDAGSFVSYKDYQEAHGRVPSHVFIAEPINYVDSAELYTISLALRGSLTISGGENYVTLDDYKKLTGDPVPEGAPRYTFDAVSGEYKEAADGEYVKVVGSMNAIGDILGGIMGDMRSMLVIGENYNAEILFEIKAKVSYDFGSPSKPGNEAAGADTLWITEIDLAIDTWIRQSSDNRLRHFIGLYYDSDVETGESALYADLTWLLGAGAKVKIDMSAYSLQDLLNSTGLLGSLTGATTSAEGLAAANEEAANIKNPDTASVLLSLTTRKIALSVSAGFVRLLIGLIAPDAAETVEQLLPNVTAEVGIGLAPYALGIDLTLHDESGEFDILGIGIKLNLFDASDKNSSLRLDLGATEDFHELDADRLAAMSSDYIFYQAMFTPILGDDTPVGGEATYRAEAPGADEKSFERVYGNTDGSLLYRLNDEATYSLVDEVFYSYARADYYNRYAMVPAGFEVWDGVVGEGEVAPATWFYTYDYETGTPVMKEYTEKAYADYIAEITAQTDKANAGEGIYDLVYDASALGAKLYIYTGTLAGEDLTAYIADSANYTVPVYDTLGAHKRSVGFAGYNELMALDLDKLLNGGGLQVSDLASMLTVEDIELTLSLDLSLEFGEIINWTQQMTELLAVEGEAANYFKFLLQAATLSQAEFLAYIGGELTLTAYIKGESVKKALASMGGTESADTMALIKTMLAGAQICIEFFYDTNFHGEPTDASVLTLWVAFDKDAMASIYIDGGGFAEYAGLVDTSGSGGNFFDKIKLEGLDIFSMLAPAEASEGVEGLGSADPEDVVGNPILGTVNDGSGGDFGMLPSNIWGYINMILGHLLIADDTIGIGLAENLVANLIDNFIEDFSGLEYLPKLSVSYDAESSGIAILLGEQPTIKVTVGVLSGGEFYGTKDEALELLANDTNGKANYGITEENFDSVVGAPVLIEENGDYRFAQEGEIANAYFFADEEYALAAYASSENVWLGDRYKLVIDDAAAGEYHFAPVANALDGAFEQNNGGAFVELNETDVQGKFSSRFQSQATGYISYEVGDYVALTTYLRVTGATSVAESRRYAFDETKVADGAHFMKLGDLKLTIELGDLGLKVGQGDPSNPAPKGNEEYRDIMKDGGVRISTSIDVSFYGAEGEMVDLGSVLDFIVGLLNVSGVSGNDLRLNITSALGYPDSPYFNVALDIYADLPKLLGALLGGGEGEAKISNALQLALEIKQYEPQEGGGYELGGTLIGVYLANDTLYVDLSALLGDTAKISISGLNIIDLIMNSASAETPAEGETPAETTAEGFAAGIADILGATSHDYAYIGALVNPGYICIQLTMAAVEAILGKVSENMPEAGLPDELLDLGDIILESYGSRKDGDMLSIGIKLTDGFAAQLAIEGLYLGTNSLSSTGTLPELSSDSGYINVFDIKEGKLGETLTIGAKAQIALRMTSTGLSRDDQSNFSVIDTAAEAKEYGGKLYTSASTSALWANWDAANKDALIDEYYKTGRLYKSIYDTSLAGWAVDLIMGLLGPSLEELLGPVSSEIVNVRFANEDLNLVIDLTADLNIAAIMKFGIAGILYSDIVLDVRLSDFNRSLLKAYYLGSSRLSKSGNYYTLGKDPSGAFADSIYVDLSGLGFGTIKLSGITGLLGGTTGGIYDVIPEGASAADETSEGTEGTTEGTEGGLNISGLSLTINLSDDAVGIKLEESVIEFLFGMIGGEIAGYIPDIQSLGLELNFGDTGIQSLAVDAVLDEAGTGLQLSIGNIELGLGGLISDAEIEDMIKEVSEGYGGLAMSNTAGMMTMLQNILDTVALSLGISADKNSWFVTGSGSNGRNPVKLSGFSEVDISAASVFAIMDSTPGTIGGLIVDETVWDHAEVMNKLTIEARHPGISSGAQKTLWAYFGNSNLYLSGLVKLMDGGGGSWLGSAVEGIIRDLGLINLGGLLGSTLGGEDGKLLPSFAGQDADTGVWIEPQGSSAAETSSATKESGAEATTSSVENAGALNGSYTNAVNSYYAYQGGELTDVLNGLIKGLDLNLFTDSGYTPYLSGMKLASNSDGVDPTQFISIKVKLDKVAYNELLIYLYTMILGLMQGTDADGDGVVDKDAKGHFTGIDAGGPNGNDADYFFDGNGNRILYHAGPGANDDNRDYIISNLFRHLNNIQNTPLTADYTRQDRVQDQVDILEPYIRSLPFALPVWLIYHMLYSTLDGVVPIIDVPNALLEHGGLIFQTIAGLLGTALPPFADMLNPDTPDPSLNIYIDLNPQGSMYGVGNKVVAAGIQAIELMVNCTKQDATRQLEGTRLIGVTEGAANGTTEGEISSLYDAYVLSINPYNLLNGTETDYEGRGVLTLAEVEATAVDTPASILVSDPGKRTATIMSNPDGTGEQQGSGVLNSTLLTANNGFPSEITVRIVDDTGMKAEAVGGESSTPFGGDGFVTTNESWSYTGNREVSGTGLVQTVDIVWDASSVDLVAATKATANDNGLRLAGHVYGYALNEVVAIVPVYLTNDYAVSTVQAYVNYDDPNGTRSTQELTLDASRKNATSLPDIISVTFVSGVSYLFGEALKDPVSGESYQAIRPSANGPFKLDGVSYEGVTVKDEETGESTTTPTVYPAYKAYLVEVAKGTAGAVEVDGKFYKSVTYENATYLVIRDGVTSGFPVGEFSWDDTSFGWEGGVQQVEFSFSWGYATETTFTADITVVENRVTSVTAAALGDYASFVENTDGATVIALDLDALLTGREVSEYKQIILDFVGGLNSVTARLGVDGEAQLAAKWDVTALEAAIDALAVKDADGNVTSYNFYLGITAGVTAWLGGSEATGTSGREFYASGVFNGEGSTDERYADKGFIAQAHPVTVLVYSNVVSEVSSDLTFDPYAAASVTMDPDDFLGKSVSVELSDGTVRTLAIEETESSDALTPVGIYVMNGSLMPVWDGEGEKPAAYVTTEQLMREISFEGYSGVYGDIFLRVSIGTDIVVKQTVDLPITVETAAASDIRYDIRSGRSYARDFLGNFVHKEEGAAEGSWTAGGEMFGDLQYQNNNYYNIEVMWSNALFYRDSNYAVEFKLADLAAGTSYYAIVPVRRVAEDGTVFATQYERDENGNILYYDKDGNLVAADKGNPRPVYQTVKLWFTLSETGVYPEEGSTIRVTSGEFNAGFSFTDKNALPDESLVDWIIANRNGGTFEFTFKDGAGSDVTVTANIANINLGDYEGRKNTSVKTVAGEGGYNKTVTYTFTGIADGKTYTFTGSTSINIVSTFVAPPEPTVTDATVDDARFAPVTVDPLVYASFDEFLAAFKAKYARSAIYATADGEEVLGTFSSLTFGNVGYGKDNAVALPLAGGSYYASINFTDAAGGRYRATVPVTILDRTPASYEFVFEGFEKTVTRGEFGAREIVTYWNELTGAVLTVETGPDGLPTALTVLNPFAFDWATIFGSGSGLKITTADTGEQFVLSAADPFAAGAFEGYTIAAGYTNEALTITFGNGGATFAITVEFVVEPTALNMYNTDLASDTLAYNDLKLNASVYGFESLGGKVVPSLYDLLDAPTEFVWYVDGMFVAAAREAEYKDMGYTALGDDENGTYRYNYSRGAYNRVSGGEFVFVYSATARLTAEWNHSAVIYSFAGGVRNTSATVKASGTAGDISLSVSVPVNIYNSTLETIAFKTSSYDFFGGLVAKYTVGEDGVTKTFVQGTPGGKYDYFVDMTHKRVYFLADGGDNYVDLESGKFFFDPMSGIDLFEQVTVSSAIGQRTVYRWFPLQVSAVTEGGLTNSALFVGWNLGGVAFDYAGGSFTAAIVLRETEMNGGTNTVGEQRFTPDGFNITVKNRTATAAITTDTATGYATLSALTGFAPSGTFIDPYNFDMAVFRRSVTDIGAIAFTLGGKNYTFSKDGANGYTLSWDFTGFGVTYTGGIAELTALLTGPDGSTQRFTFDFLVTRVHINRIVGTKGGATDMEGVNTTFSVYAESDDPTNIGMAQGTYSIDPHIPQSHSLPKGWEISFKAWNPVYTNGEITGWNDTNYGTVTRDYIAVSMPAFDWTADLVTNGSDGSLGYATLQLDNGQRVRIPVAVTGKGDTVNPSGSSFYRQQGNLLELDTKATINGKQYTIVWVGTATVSGGSSYSVTFASAGDKYIVQPKGLRKVTYSLTGYIGAVIDESGNVLIDGDSGTPWCLATTSASGTVN